MITRVVEIADGYSFTSFEAGRWRVDGSVVGDLVSVDNAGDEIARRENVIRSKDEVAALKFSRAELAHLGKELPTVDWLKDDLVELCGLKEIVLVGSPTKDDILALINGETVKDEAE